jgi:hypothetical protein
MEENNYGPLSHRISHRLIDIHVKVYGSLGEIYILPILYILGYLYLRKYGLDKPRCGRLRPYK